LISDAKKKQTGSAAEKDKYETRLLDRTGRTKWTKEGEEKQRTHSPHSASLPINHTKEKREEQR
jgi:hypothetical protein